jgi:hypothetical protein
VLRLTLFVPTPTQLHEENNLALKKDLQECLFLAQFMAVVEGLKILHRDNGKISISFLSLCFFVMQLLCR